MSARLVPLSPGPVRPIPLERPVVLIGRHQECDAQLSHSRISRRHCCVAQIAGGLVIRDLGSLNGVRINGYPVDEASLEDGDEVAIGPILFRLDWPRASDSGAEPAPTDPASTELAEDDLVPLDDD